MEMVLILILVLGLLARTQGVTTIEGVRLIKGAVGPTVNPVTAAKRSSGSVPLKGNPMDLYDVRLQVGHQSFAILLDTGSSNLILPGAKCSGCGPVLTSYEPSARSTDLRIYDFVEYGMFPDVTGAYGDFFLDDIVMDGVDPVSIVVMSVTASGLQGPNSSVRKGQPMRGIFGVGPEYLGFLNMHGIGRLGNDSYLNALGKWTNVASILSVQLCATDGFLWLGYPNSKHLGADPEYTPVLIITDQWGHVRPTTYAVWMGMHFGAQVNGNITGFADVDTGCNNLWLPKQDYETFMSAINPKGDLFDSDGCLYDKSLHPGAWPLPHVTMSFIKNLTDKTSGTSFKVSADVSYMVPAVQADGSTSWCHTLMCCSDIVLLGAPMMRHFVILFDLNNNLTGPRVGFAPQQEGTCTSQPPYPSPPPPPPGDHQRESHKWKYVLWVVVVVVALSAFIGFLEYHHRGPHTWVNVLQQWKDRRIGMQDDVETSLINQSTSER